jgi:putative endonuclease
MNNHTYYVYILTNKNKTILYIGITNNLERRIHEHKQKVIDGFSKKYNIDQVMYIEECSNSTDAITREKQLKNWHKEWKWNLIKQHNPTLKDLFTQSS